MTRSSRAQIVVVVVVVLAAGAWGCVAPPADPATDDAIPFARDFQGFESWPSQMLESATASGSSHVSGRRIVYINHALAADATTFPVGTLIVKRTDADGTLSAVQRLVTAPSPMALTMARKASARSAGRGS